MVNRTKKHGKSYYGHKLHTLTDMSYGLIRRLETTTAEIHDSQIDLSQPGEDGLPRQGILWSTMPRP